MVLANLAINILMASSLQFLWSLMNAVQLIVHEPLLSISFPAEAHIFLKMLMGILKFKIIPTDKILAFLVNVKEKGEDNGLGYSSENLLANLGMMALMIPLLLLAIGGLFLLKCLMMKWEVTKKLYALLSKKLLFNSICRLLIQGYLQFASTAAISLKAHNRIDSAFLMLGMVLLPPGILVFLIHN